jgi:hypothetical protein
MVPPFPLRAIDALREVTRIRLWKEAAPAERRASLCFLLCAANARKGYASQFSADFVERKPDFAVQVDRMGDLSRSRMPA